MGAIVHIDATWSAADVDRLPDSAFLFVSPGGTKDSDGKTVPRALRHFPYRGEDGAIDLPHLRDAIGRIPQSDAPGLTAEAKTSLQAEATKLLADAEKKTDSADGIARGVSRFDVSELKPLRMTQEGWAIADGFIGRTGLLRYTRNGKPWVEYRPPEEAFSPDSLDSFDLVPLTNDHPPPNQRLHGARILDSENASRYAVGVVAAPHRDGDMVRAKIRITDAAAIEDLKRGRSQLSCGYLADVDPTPGVFEGQRYDALQRNVRGNHVALVAEGRAGPSARVRVDSYECDPVASTHGQGDRKMKTTIKLDGIDFEVECADAAFSQALAKDGKARADATANGAALLAAARSETEKANARSDAAEAALKAKADELDKAPARVKAELEARSRLVATGIDVLGPDAKIDGMPDSEIKTAVILAISPEAKLEGRSQVYLDARFDAAVEMAGRSALERGSGPKTTRADAAAKDEDEDEEDEDMRDKFQKASREAAKPKPKKR